MSTFRIQREDVSGASSAAGTIDEPHFAFCAHLMRLRKKASFLEKSLEGIPQGLKPVPFYWLYRPD
ncbi:MAG: hypothetical protein WBQ94_15020 [Terracidiphilus sp.]